MTYDRFLTVAALKPHSLGVTRLLYGLSFTGCRDFTIMKSDLRSGR